MKGYSDSATDPEILQVLIRALRKLAEAGQADAANRLAATAWKSLRHRDPASAERINGTMHYLSRFPDEVNAAQNHSPSASKHRPE